MNQEALPPWQTHKKRLVTQETPAYLIGIYVREENLQ